MESIGIITIVLFIVIIFIVWKVTIEDHRKAYSKKMWTHWGVKAYYWQGVIIISSGITFLALILLRWGNIVSF